MRWTLLSLSHDFFALIAGRSNYLQVDPVQIANCGRSVSDSDIKAGREPNDLGAR